MRREVERRTQSLRDIAKLFREIKNDAWAAYEDFSKRGIPAENRYLKITPAQFAEAQKLGIEKYLGLTLCT